MRRHWGCVQRLSANEHVATRKVRRPPLGRRRRIRTLASVEPAPRKLFDEGPRTDSSPARDTEKSFAFLNRRAGAFWDRLRTELENWYAEYPDNNGDLISRFQDPVAAFGVRRRSAPAMSSSTKNPDFVVSRDTTSFYVECVAKFGDSGIDNPAGRAWICECTNRAKHPDFMVNPSEHSKEEPMSNPGFGGAIFDVDGVLVDSPHERAWRESLRDLMEKDWVDIRGQTDWAPERFTPQVYQQVISGKPRMSGALAALEYFRVPDTSERAQTYADHKQHLLIELINAGQFHAYPDALRFVMAVHAAGIPTAAASSSKNADLLLSQIRLDTFAGEEGLHYDFLRPGFRLVDIFDKDLSGRDFARGKPDPEIFLTSAAELGVAPGRCFVAEDAVSGIQAAKAGAMAALAVARAGDQVALAAAGADLVVTSLDKVDVAALAAGKLTTRTT